MAITWDVKITVLDESKKAISFNAVMTDNTNPDKIKVESYSVLYAIIETSAQKLDVMNNILAQYQTNLAKQTRINTLVGSLEADAKAFLEARS